MYLALQDLMGRRPESAPIVEHALPHLIDGSFCRIADCGAGVGHTAGHYVAAMRARFQSGMPERARVVCFEPLAENAAIIRERFRSEPLVEIREEAVSRDAGQAVFSVPGRMTVDQGGGWVPGTSYGGLLGNIGFGEQITVPTVRLDSFPSFDFVKLDLQGGEPDALLGLGSRLRDVGIFYVEHGLFTPHDAIRSLEEQGFTVFFDQLQIGLRATDNQTIRLDEMKKRGLEIHAIYPPTVGLPLMFWGRFDSSKFCMLSENGALTAEAREAYIQLGIDYIQTDIIAVNPSMMKRFGKFIASLR